MARRRQVYEGKGKVLFEGPEPGTLVQYFKDDALAVSDGRHGVITGTVSYTHLTLPTIYSV